jgi:hypothetical protein
VHRKDHDVTLMLLLDSITGTLLFTYTRRIKLVRTATSLPSRVSNDAQPPIFIDSSEVKQYVIALCRTMSITL